MVIGMKVKWWSAHLASQKYGEQYPASPKLRTSSNYLTFLTKLLNIEVLYNKYLPRKIITSSLPTETKASSTVLNHGDVAQMVACERYGN